MVGILLSYWNPIFRGELLVIPRPLPFPPSRVCELPCGQIIRAIAIVAEASGYRQLGHCILALNDGSCCFLCLAHPLTKALLSQWLTFKLLGITYLVLSQLVIIPAVSFREGSSSPTSWHFWRWLSFSPQLGIFDLFFGVGSLNQLIWANYNDLSPPVGHLSFSWRWIGLGNSRPKSPKDSGLGISSNGCFQK